MKCYWDTCENEAHWIVEGLETSVVRASCSAHVAACLWKAECLHPAGERVFSVISMECNGVYATELKKQLEEKEEPYPELLAKG